MNGHVRETSRTIVRTVSSDGIGQRGRGWVRTVGLWIVAALQLALAAPAPAQQAVGASAPVLALRSGVQELAGRGWPPPQADIVALVDRTFDMARITRAVLGRHGATAPLEQQTKLAQVLRLRMAQQMLRTRPAADDGFTVVETRPAGADQWLVITRVEPAGTGEPVVLGWRVAGTGSQGRIVDVQRDGVSATTTQRDDFAAAVGKLGLDGAIAEMERRVSARP
jgi:ABC-type transporter MlaC component